MSDLFKKSLFEYYGVAAQRTREFIALLPCSSIETTSPGFVASKTTDQFCLVVPSMDPTPVEKTLSDDGTLADYVHTINNGPSFAYRPMSLQFGGPPHRFELEGDRLVIHIPDADGNPGPRQRHEIIVNQLTANLAALATEIEGGNANLVAMIEPELAKRKAHCAEIARRQDLL